MPDLKQKSSDREQSALMGANICKSEEVGGASAGSEVRVRVKIQVLMMNNRLSSVLWKLVDGFGWRCAVEVRW